MLSLDEFEEQLNAIFERFAQQLYDARGVVNRSVSEEMVLLISELLEEAMVQGLGADLDRIDDVLADTLRREVFLFSGVKTYAQADALSSLMTNADGSLRPFTAFREAALKINEQYNLNWLRTEYDTAQRTARAVGKWQQIERTKAAMPYLQYFTVGDGRVRPDHREWEGIILPVDHPFWDTHFPPNAWNCRCVVRQLGADATPDELDPAALETIPQPDAYWSFNPGKQERLFPEGHPYWRRLDDFKHDYEIDDSE